MDKTQYCIPLIYEGRIATDLVNFMELVCMKQFNKLRNLNGITLDLALSNCHNIELFETDPLSRVELHHPTFSIEIKNIHIKFLKSRRTAKINFYAMNYDAINNELNKVQWKEMLKIPEDINLAVNAFYAIIKNIISKYAKFTHPKDDCYPKWFSNQLIQVLKEKEEFHDLSKTKNGKIYEKIYKEKRKLFKSLKSKCELTYIGNTEKKIISNPKAFFAYTKAVCKSNKLPNEMNFNGLVSDNVQTITEYFADNFKSVYNQTNQNNVQYMIIRIVIATHIY